MKSQYESHGMHVNATQVPTNEAGCAMIFKASQKDSLAALMRELAYTPLLIPLHLLASPLRRPRVAFSPATEPSKCVLTFKQLSRSR